jgi:hypothetical protein
MLLCYECRDAPVVCVTVLCGSERAEMRTALRSPAPSPNPHLTTCPPAAAQAPPATHPSPASLKGKGPATLSPHAPPFYPADHPGRSKAMNWSEDSDFSDDNTEGNRVGNPGILPRRRPPGLSDVGRLGGRDQCPATHLRH